MGKVNAIPVSTISVLRARFRPCLASLNAKFLFFFVTGITEEKVECILTI